MLCSELHCQKGFELILFSHKIVAQEFCSKPSWMGENLDGDADWGEHEPGKPGEESVRLRSRAQAGVA